MATKDGFAPDDAFPVFLSEHAEHAEEPEQPAIRKAWDGAVISSRILKTGILVVTAAAIDFAILSMGNPVALFANATASLVDISALQPGTGQSTPTIQSTAGALPQTARDAPTRDEITAALEPADQSQAEIRQPSAETLLKQFQAWAAEQETRDDITGALQPADQSQTEIGQPSAEALLKQFQAWAAEQDARAQIGPVQPVQDARAQVVQNARLQVRPLQNAQAPLPLRSIGWLD
jgi:hypothetical protein